MVAKTVAKRLEPATKLEPAMRPRTFAESVDLSVDTIYKKIAAGQIRVLRMGRTIRIPRSEALRLRGEAVET